jgi:hypothetical protein
MAAINVRRNYWIPGAARNDGRSKYNLSVIPAQPESRLARISHQAAWNADKTLVLLRKPG